ncbi:hypothetical protein [Streptomyces peucetius]|uniref:Uncharacterized protein n=1 Tax=Streptomyces peucetius TaxID=1950 RepID=A0ABY6I352_STRPE|nr:hypothetical protein [Streptomyces peucetius]UYQ60442.1 hypothetical protein OGH68_02415 [Streptomyces peucetius]
MDTGPAPEEIRQALLTEHGAAGLRLAHKEGSLVPVLRALRELHHLSLGEARLVAADLQAAGLVGTPMEIAYLAQGLRVRSVAVVITSSG